jgi:hypothetical protein
VGAWTPGSVQRPWAGVCLLLWRGVVGAGVCLSSGPAREHQGACEIGDPSLPCCVPGVVQRCAALRCDAAPPRPDTDATCDQGVTLVLHVLRGWYVRVSPPGSPWRSLSLVQSLIGAKDSRGALEFLRTQLTCTNYYSTRSVK